MTDQGPLGRPPRGASVPGGAPCGAGPQLTDLCVPKHKVVTSAAHNCDVKSHLGIATSRRALGLRDSLYAAGLAERMGGSTALILPLIRRTATVQSRLA
jgi:hypothetical protein